VDRVTEVRGIVGANVKRERERKGLTQSELARAAGMDLTTAQRLEAGRTAKLATVVAVADALGIAVWQLFKPKGR
jgi:transcriptional regulator with XRE-family HTH domain